MHSDKSQQLRTILVTGGTTGIGFETARRLLSSPEHRVIILGRQAHHVEKAVQNLGGASSKLTGYVCDLQNEDQIAVTAEKITNTHRQLYGIVHCAGIYPFGNIETTRSQEWDYTLAINLKAPFLMTQKLVPLLKKNSDGSRVVMVSSTAAILPNHFALAYTVSKAALVQLSRTLAKELGSSGITVNCICPGIVKSPLHEAYMPNKTELEEFYAKRGQAYPTGRVGEPDDVAQAILFYLDPKSSWITGDVMTVDGGRLLV